MERGEEQHPADGPNQARPGRLPRQAVDRIPDHPRDEESEQGGREEAGGAEQVV